ncbi:D-alanine--D-alanine ligase [soil metagenome]
MPGPLRVLHLAGSAVSDFHADLSLLYARDCWTATADPDRYDFVAAVVSPDGRWRFPGDLGPQAIAAAPPVGVGEAVTRLAGAGIDVAVPQLFCLPGMTSYRALLDVLAIPYVGNPPDVMALGAHKARTRAVVAAAGVAVPRGEVLRAGQQPTLAPPVVVKPVDADNSLGISLVREPGEYTAALRSAFAESDVVLVEEYVELGREVRCGVVERHTDAGVDLVALPLEEYAVDPVSKPIRGRDDKLRRDPDGDLHLVAKDAEHAWILDLDDPATEAVHAAARRCHEALGCRDYSLFDFRLDAQGRPWFLEAGLYCSFARASVVAVMAEANGVHLADLFGEMVAHHVPLAGR